jgi:hypothetical protein
MRRIGITGHVTITTGTADLVYAALAKQLRLLDDGGLRGVTCLADGADQLFARAVLACDGSYEVVIPARDYRLAAVTAENRAAFDELLERAAAVSCMPFPHSNREAYLAASLEMLNRCDLLLAVWDGHPSAVVGDTADVVRVARERRIPVTVLWPNGSARRGPSGPATPARQGQGRSGGS